ncbi:hypothetical protein [Microbacterium sp. 10M-3C3]|jgi:hypothetical protein|uniref:hypothetical protein n=1 Tax=Microbacterium sp. 10M-3C3 TaxID=2483401 RepID=UPI0013DE2A30|nr:hypothetical protein [Microbacterium sp. 10M-3C3]
MRRPIAALAVAAALVLALAAPATAAGGVQCPTPAPSASSAGEGIGLSAVVCGPAASGSTGGTSGGAPSGTGSSGTSGGSRGATGSTGGAPSSVSPSPSTPAVSLDDVDLGGILSIGGLSTGSSPSANPFSGEVQVWFTVRNMSHSTIDLTADFWMENVFGVRIATIDGVDVSSLKPGETRTVSADLPGAGQWTVLTTHARVNPPAEVDGTELSSLTRDATVFVLPWLLVLLAALAALAGICVPLVRRELIAARPVAATP